MPINLSGFLCRCSKETFSILLFSILPNLVVTFEFFNPMVCGVFISIHMDLEGLVTEVQNMKNCPIIDVESCTSEFLLNTNTSQMCCGDDILPDGFMIVH